MTTYSTKLLDDSSYDPNGLVRSLSHAWWVDGITQGLLK